jgi:sensor domain CHASE-containing protein
MTLNKKALLIVAVTTFVLIVTLHLSSRIILLGSFAKIEERHQRENLQRVLSAIDSDLSALSATVFDWAAWNDTYEFILDMNKEYIASNPTDEGLAGIRINVMIYVDAAGQIKFSKGYDLIEEKEIPIPPGLLALLKDNKAFTNHPNIKSHFGGFVDLPSGPMMVVSRPIVTSENTGPIRGSLIMARFWNDVEIKRLAKTTRMALDVRPLDAPSLPEDFVAARAALSKETPFFIRPSSDQLIAGFAVIRSIHDNPYLLLKVETTRDIYSQAKDSLAYYLTSTAIIGLAICAIVYILLKKLVVDRLALLAAGVRHIDIAAEPDERVEVGGNDEVAYLGRTINKMLDNLAVAHEDLRESLEHISTLRGIIPICAHCRKVKDDAGYWHQVETYVSDHSEAEFTHGLCEECMKELYPELVDRVLGDKDDDSRETGITEDE